MQWDGESAPEGYIYEKDLIVAKKGEEAFQLLFTNYNSDASLEQTVDDLADIGVTLTTDQVGEYFVDLERIADKLNRIFPAE